MDARIELQAVEKSYRMGDVTVHALRGLDLKVAPGEFLVLLGPSDCGKTTTLNLIGGLYKVSGGRVVVAGEDISHYDEQRLTDCFACYPPRQPA